MEIIIFTVVFFALGLGIGICAEQPKYVKNIEKNSYEYRLRIVKMFLENTKRSFNKYLSTDPVNEDLLVGILEQQEFQIEQIKSLLGEAV